MNEQMEYYLQAIRDELPFNNYHLTVVIRNYTEAILSMDCCRQSPKYVEAAFEEIASSCANVETAVYFYSAALTVDRSCLIFESVLNFCLQNRERLSPNTLYFLYGQFESLIFRIPHFATAGNNAKVQKIFDYAVSGYASALGEYLLPIDESERNNDLAIVLTGQFLSIQHGPTKSAADRCKVIMEKMHKKVLLINTAELLSVVGEIPFVDCTYANYNEALTEAETVEWKSCIIPYFQCENNMPNLVTVRMLLSMIRRQKPAFILSIGAGGVVAALAAKMVPALCIGMIPSTLSVTGANYQTLSHLPGVEDKDFLEAVGKREDSVIVGAFGSSILSVTAQLERESIGLPPESWLAAVVGARLDDELTSDFWNMVVKMARTGIEYVLIGRYDPRGLEKVYREHPSLRNKIHCVGLVENTLNYLNLCNLYINPVRRGGGTSSVEAMSLGIPVITTRYGDVATNAGEIFCVASYDAMPELAEQYMHDPVLYAERSRLAKERAAVLLNAEDSFVQIILEFLKRSGRK